MTRLLSQADKRNRNLRVVLFIIILATLPFYCIGFVLWGTAPSNRAPLPTTPAAASATPLVEVRTATPPLLVSITPLTSGTQLSPLLPTPIQFNTPIPDGGSILFPPVSTSPPVLIPTSTLAPTLTPFPTNTPIPPPTNTIPPPPSAVPAATNTTVPIPTEDPATLQPAPDLSAG